AYSMIFLPALMAVLPLKARKPGKRAPMGRLGSFLVINRRRLLWGISAGAVLIAGFLPLNVLEDRFIEYLDESIPMRVDTDFAVEHLTGAYVMEFSVPAGAPGAVSEPEYLDRLENFANWLRAQPEIDHVTSFTDVMKRLNKSMHGDNQAWYHLPERRDLAAQYLLLYEMSLPYGLDLNTQINVDKSATRLTVILENIPSTRMRDVKTRAEIWLRDNALPEMGSEGTGPAIMFAYISQRNIQTMFVGTGVAFLLISAILVLTLHSVRLGLISLIPNILPALITFGLWGLFVGHVGLAAAAIMATTMGLVVDDTVHVLSIYNRARREHCFGTHDAIRFCYAHVGKALFVTTTVLVAGFGILGTSSFGVNSDQGQLTAIALTVALALDFLLLPSLLMYLDEERVCECVTCVAANLKEQGT
ncbi:MAG: MMPL family transporter, partial [Rhodospirillales bacterium]|nr:MMPL family transporter [Rhodospirillales bacterium]